MDKRRVDDGLLGRGFDRAINIIQVVALIGGGFYFAGNMSGRLDNVTTLISNISDNVKSLTSRVDSLMDHR